MKVPSTFLKHHMHAGKPQNPTKYKSMELNKGSELPAMALNSSGLLRVSTDRLGVKSSLQCNSLLF